MRDGPPSRLEVITGPMFSGKSEELMRRVRRARIAGLDTLVVGHALDTRSDTGQVASHAGQRLDARPVAAVGELLSAVAAARPNLLAIDEAQFFGMELVEAVTTIVAAGTTVIAEGLCVTFDGRPFEPLPSLMAQAESVAKLTAVCSVCGEDAVFHQRIAGRDATWLARPNAAPSELTAASKLTDASELTDVSQLGNVSELSDESEAGRAGDPADALLATSRHVGGVETYQARCRRHFTAWA